MKKLKHLIINKKIHCRFLLLNYFILFASLCFSYQSLSAQQVIATSGDYHESSGYSISWTLGEMVTETLESEGNILTQGFHQTQLTVVSVDEIADPDYQITAYPNPAREFLTLKTEGENYENVRFLMYDSNGKLIKQGDINERYTQISLTGFKPSLYFIQVIANSKKLKTFQIIKQ